MSSADSDEAALVALGKLHDEIDREARALADRHGSRIRCRRGCSACCVDGLTVTRIEALRIRRAYPALLKSESPHPEGSCAFLDSDGACRIYDHRPTVCRSQGLPLRVLFENETLEIEERRDICPLNLEGGPALESLDEEDCWLVGTYELRLNQLDERAFEESTEPEDGENGRVALRGLFLAD